MVIGGITLNGIENLGNGGTGWHQRVLMLADS